MFWKVILVCMLSYLSVNIQIIKSAPHICGKSNHNKSTGELVPYNEQVPPGETCEWHIYPEKYAMSEVFLVFEVFELESADECTVQKHGGPILFGPFSGKKGTFSVLTGYLLLDVTLKTASTPSSERKFKSQFSSNKCYYKIENQSGRIESPLYKDMGRKDNVICTWEFRDFKGIDFIYAVTFDDVNLINSSLHIKNSKSDGIYNSANIPPNIVALDKTILELHLNTNVPGEKFAFNFVSQGTGTDPFKYPTDKTTDPSAKISTPAPTPEINDIPLICGKNDNREENGTISLGNPANKNIGFTCSWIIDNNDISNAKEIFISVEQFNLADDDTFTIFEPSGQALFGPYQGRKSYFSILTGVLELEARLQIASNHPNVERKFRIDYSSKDCVNHLNDNRIGELPIYKQRNKNEDVSCIWTFNLNNDIFEMVSFRNLKFNGQLSIEGNADPKRSYSEKDVPADVLIREGGTIKLDFSPSKETEFTFTYERVKQECSKFIKLNEDMQSVSISSPSQEKAINNWADCFWTVESPKNTVINLEIRELILPNHKDTVQIFDGDSGKAPLLSHLNARNEMKTLKSRDNSLVIFFSTQFAQYAKFEANLKIGSCTSFCDNGFCKLGSWECNGLNECGDLSDEKNCTEIHIVPSEGEKSKDENKLIGFSSTTLGLSILGSIFGGILITVGFVALRQIYKSRNQLGYDHYPIYNDS